MAKDSVNSKFRNAQKNIVIIGDHNTVEKPSSIMTPTRVIISVALLLVIAGLLIYFLIISPTREAPSHDTNLFDTSSPKPPTETHQIEVTSRNITTIKLEKDDRAMISAEGQIRLGLLAGVGGPEGVPGFTQYNIYADDRHGALFARVRGDDGEEKWKRIGKQGVILAEHVGVLEFLVNDNDPGNNQGSFKVTVQVYRKK